MRWRWMRANGVDPEFPTARRHRRQGVCCAILWLTLRGACAQGVCDDPLPAGGTQDALGKDLCATIDPTDQAATVLHGVVVESQGRLLASRYFSGRDKVVGHLFGYEAKFGPDSVHDMRSVSKSVVSLLVGVAQAEGKIGSVDTPVLTYFPASQRPAEMAPGWQGVTLRDLLTMSSGLDWKEDGIFGNQTRMEFSSDQARYVLSRAIAEPPGKRFHYVSGNTVLLGRILENVTGMDLESYGRQALFGPLGITDLEWRKGRDGHAFAHAGLRMRPSDLIKIGELVRHEGMWNGRQVVPRAWIQASIDTQIATENGWNYGYQWRNGDAVVNGRSWHWIAAFGNGGQRL